MTYNEDILSALSEIHKGEIVTAFVGIVQLVDADGMTTRLSFMAPDQTMTTTTGLIELMRIQNELRVTRALEDDLDI